MPYAEQISMHLKEWKKPYLLQTIQWGQVAAKLPYHGRFQLHKQILAGESNLHIVPSSS